jgi:hypothetical protein
VEAEESGWMSSGVDEPWAMSGKVGLGPNRRLVKHWSRIFRQRRRETSSNRSER